MGYLKQKQIEEKELYKNKGDNYVVSTNNFSNTSISSKNDTTGKKRKNNTSRNNKRN